MIILAKLLYVFTEKSFTVLNHKTIWLNAISKKKSIAVLSQKI